MDCIFCKIGNGDIPCEKILETDKIIAFMDINPLSDGHVLFIPKMHAEKMHEVPDDVLMEILPAMKKVALALGVKNYNILQNNGKIAHQEVKHAHWHLIPKTENEGLVISWKPKVDKNIEKIADQIRSNL